jgi:N-acetylmuramic acid 6-phosphate etherase
MDTYLGSLTTEQINGKTSHIDVCTTTEILQIINEEDMLVPIAVKKEIPNIAQAVDAIVNSIKNGGRLFYIGAGTSGRIGILLTISFYILCKFFSTIIFIFESIFCPRNLSMKI